MATPPDDTSPTGDSTLNFLSRAAEPQPLLFTGRSRTFDENNLFFRGPVPDPDLTSDYLNVSDDLWELIRNGTLIRNLQERRKLAQERYWKHDEDLNSVKVKCPTQNTCHILSDNIHKLTITRAHTGTLGLSAQTDASSGIHPIRLMIATAREIAILQVNLRVKSQLGDTTSLSPEERSKKESEIRKQILSTNPQLFAFNISHCAKPSDVADMLAAMKETDPELTATLTDEMVACVQKAMSDRAGDLSEANKKILTIQLEKQGIIKPTPPEKRPEAPRAP